MRHPHAAALLAVLTGALLLGGACKKAETPPSPELTTFEKKVILGLEDLEKTPAAEDFIRELDSDTALRAAVERGPQGAEVGRFKALVQRHAKNDDFRRAVENPSPAEEAPPCGEPEPIEEKPFVLEAEPGCAAESPLIGEQDIFAPPPDDK